MIGRSHLLGRDWTCAACPDQTWPGMPDEMNRLPLAIGGSHVVPLHPNRSRSKRSNGKRGHLVTPKRRERQSTAFGAGKRCVGKRARSSTAGTPEKTRRWTPDEALQELRAPISKTMAFSLRP